MNIFKFNDYREAFSELFQDLRSKKVWSTASLAEAVGLQPSYLTNVIKGRAHFSSDQIHALGEVLKLKNEEIDYLDLLMCWERSINARRKEKLSREVEKIQNSQRRANRNIEAKASLQSKSIQERYYLDPMIEMIHLYLRTKKAKHDIQDIAKEWSLHRETAASIIDFLEKNQIIHWQGKKWKVEPVHQLLDHQSPYAIPHQMMKRIRAMDIIQKSPPNEVYSFTASLTMDQKSKLQIQGEFVEFLKKCEKIVLKSNPEDLYHFQFDLFPWLPRRDDK